ncbi:MAG: hypothetical protein ABS935_02955 [Solibacillus sp.]|uniref:hypothetical protein n=1 Tax=Solibacillus sp. TaxID=1909654 RepID=UPI0033158D5D
MNSHVKRLFLGEIEKQLHFSEISLSKMKNISDDFNNGLWDDAENNSTLFWYATQSLLVSLANISKILYPVKSKYKKRGEILRRELSITAQNIFKDRRVRNSFEHYDEHIDDFFSQVKSGSIFVDSNMGEIKIEGVIAPIVFMRNYLLKEQKITFKDLSLDLQDVEEGLSDLRVKLDNSLSKYM